MKWCHFRLVKTHTRIKTSFCVCACTHTHLYIHIPKMLSTQLHLQTALRLAQGACLLGLGHTFVIEQHLTSSEEHTGLRCAATCLDALFMAMVCRLWVAFNIDFTSNGFD